jgi:hypothetical protein
VELVAGREDDGRQQQVEEVLVVEVDEISDRVEARDAQDQADGHAAEDGDDGFVDGRDLALLHGVAGAEGHDEQHDQDEDGP